MNSEAMQVAYGFASAAFIIGASILIIESMMKHDVSEEKLLMAALCLPMLLWAVVLAGAAWLFI